MIKKFMTLILMLFVCSIFMVGQTDMEKSAKWLQIGLKEQLSNFEIENIVPLVVTNNVFLYISFTTLEEFTRKDYITISGFMGGFFQEAGRTDLFVPIGFYMFSNEGAPVLLGKVSIELFIEFADAIDNDNVIYAKKCFDRMFTWYTWTEKD